MSDGTTDSGLFDLANTGGGKVMFHVPGREPVEITPVDLRNIFEPGWRGDVRQWREEATADGLRIAEREVLRVIGQSSDPHTCDVLTRIAEWLNTQARFYDEHGAPRMGRDTWGISRNGEALDRAPGAEIENPGEDDEQAEGE
ncbi:MAG: hypothetical protein AB7P99_04755 [Vicinamibacterales bacterium]